MWLGEPRAAANVLAAIAKASQVMGDEMGLDFKLKCNMGFSQSNLSFTAAAIIRVYTYSSLAS